MSDVNLRESDIDRLAKTLVTLAKELWIAKDRQLLLEAALLDAGVIMDGLDKYQPTDEQKEQLSKERSAFIEQLLYALEKEG